MRTMLGLWQRKDKAINVCVHVVTKDMKISDSHIKNADCPADEQENTLNGSPCLLHDKSCDNNGCSPVSM